jgi:hypothetical protein
MFRAALSASEPPGWAAGMASICVSPDVSICVSPDVRSWQETQT